MEKIAFGRVGISARGEAASTPPNAIRRPESRAVASLRFLLRCLRRYRDTYLEEEGKSPRYVALFGERFAFPTIQRAKQIKCQFINVSSVKSSTE